MNSALHLAAKAELKKENPDIYILKALVRSTLLGSRVPRMPEVSLRLKFQLDYLGHLYCADGHPSGFPIGYIIGSYANSVIPYLFILAFIPFVVTYYVTRFRVESGTQKMQRVCQNHSSDGVEYHFRDESWGGCNERQHTKRYYVTIKCTSLEQQQAATVFTNVTSTQPEYWNDEMYSTSPSVRLKVTASSANNPTTIYDPEPSAPYLQDISALPPSGPSIFKQIEQEVTWFKKAILFFG